MGNSTSSDRLHDDGDHASVSHPEMSVQDALKCFQAIPHVRRGSLVLARNGKGTARSPSFIVDAPTAGCRVAIYTFAWEGADGAIHASGLPILALDFPAGMNQPFPGEYNLPIDMAHLQDYIKPSSSGFPILIRIESLSRRHVPANQGLAALPAVGSAVTYFMNVHTVFAHLKLNAGAWDIEVLKEHIWVEGTPRLLPSAAEVAAYQRQAPKPRLAATTAQLKERNQQVQQAQLLQQQQQQQQQQQWLKQQKQQQQLLKQQKQQQLLLKQQQQLKQQQAAAQQAYAQQQALFPSVSYAQQLAQSLPMTMPTSLPLVNSQLPYAAPTVYPATPGLPPAAPLFPTSQPLVPTSVAQPAGLQSPFAAGSAGGLQSPFAGGAGLAPQNAVPWPVLDQGWSHVAQGA